MTDLRIESHDESYPAQLVINPSTGATAGIPGTWTPAGTTPPYSTIDLVQGNPVAVTASPATPWTSGQYVQTREAGAAGRATWTGTGWVGGAAPLDEEEPDQESEPEPYEEPEPETFGEPIPVDELPE